MRDSTHLHGEIRVIPSQVGHDIGESLPAMLITGPFPLPPHDGQEIT